MLDVNPCVTFFQYILIFSYKKHKTMTTICDADNEMFGPSGFCVPHDPVSVSVSVVQKPRPCSPQTPPLSPSFSPLYDDDTASLNSVFSNPVCASPPLPLLPSLPPLPALPGLAKRNDRNERNDRNDHDEYKTEKTDKTGNRNFARDRDRGYEHGGRGDGYGRGGGYGRSDGYKHPGRNDEYDHYRGRGDGYDHYRGRSDGYERHVRREYDEGHERREYVDDSRHERREYGDDSRHEMRKYGDDSRHERRKYGDDSRHERRKYGDDSRHERREYGNTNIRRTVSIIFMRLRKTDDQQWYEYLVERPRAGDAYQFPQTGGRNNDAETAFFVASRVSQRGLLTPPSQSRDLEACLQHTHVCDDTFVRLYLLHFELTQRPRADRVLAAPPALFWVTSSELSTHAQVGSPSVFGLPVQAATVRAFNDLPVSLRFASTTPPVALYHGTAAGTAALVAESGLVASTCPGMLGTGIYLAKWDKAASFAVRDAGNITRGDKGVVIRCVVFLGTTCVMTRDMVCTCGCGGAFVDHGTHYGKGTQTTYVPDNSLPATRRAEWCVRDPAAILVDGQCSL